MYQLTAIDTATRWACILLVLGFPNAQVTNQVIRHVIRRYRRLGVQIRAVLSDNGPECKATTSPAAVVTKGLVHHRIPPRSPNHNAVCERHQGTALQECWRPAFHRHRLPPASTGAAENREIDTWLIHSDPEAADPQRLRSAAARPAELLSLLPTSRRHDDVLTEPKDLSPQPPARKA